MKREVPGGNIYSKLTEYTVYAGDVAVKARYVTRPFGRGTLEVFTLAPASEGLKIKRNMRTLRVQIGIKYVNRGRISSGSGRLFTLNLKI